MKKQGKSKRSPKIRPVKEKQRIQQSRVGEVRLAKVLEIVTAAANAAMSLDEVSRSLLKAICIYTGWEVGHAYFLTSFPAYRSGATAAAAHHHHQTGKYFRFWRRLESALPDAKVGLPKKVIESGAPQWNMNISSDPRFAGTSFKETGVRAGFAFPVFVDGKVVSVIEFFSADKKAPHKRLLKLMSGVSYQIGQVIERKRIEEENAWLLSREHEARSKAEKDNRTKDFFLATLSHELRTPLTSILLWIQIIRDAKATPEKIKQGMEAIEQSAQNQEKLINDLLDTSRIIMGKLSLEVCSVDIGTVIRATIESLQPLAKAKEVRLETSFDEPVGTVYADALRLQQVFWNLLSNALKFSPRGGNISIKLEFIKENGVPFAQVRVNDAGVGIPEEFLPHIFDWFSQEDNSRIREHNGLGLGLAIARNLIELQGGTISASSPGSNRGTTMTVKLPLKPTPAPKSIQSFLGHGFLPKGSAVEKVKADLNGVRVLVVDNEESIVSALSLMLKSFGADVAVALSAFNGFEIFRRFKPHILLCDIAMPQEDGYSMVKRIRALDPEEGGRTPSIALTAYAAASDIKNAKEAGFQAHITKPIDMQKLMEAVTTWGLPAQIFS